METLTQMRKPKLDLRKKIQECRNHFVTLWHTIVNLDTALHNGLYQRFPTTMRVSGWSLRLLYGIAISPAFAVILSLLLVGFVISGLVPVIVSISVFAAWLVAMLSVARSEAINKLRIAERVLVVFGVAALMAILANRYVKWCLLNYYKTQPSANASPSPKDLDALAYERFRELLDAEIPRLVQVPPPKAGDKNTPPMGTPKLTKADLSIDFAGVSDLMLMFHANTAVPVEKPKHWFTMFDATNMFIWPNKPDSPQPLPLQVQMWNDYIRQDTPTGPYSVLSESPNEAAKTHVKSGDIILGTIGVTCINCIKVRTYYVYFQMGSGGWFYAVPNGKEKDLFIPVPAANKKALSIAEIEDAMDKVVPPSLRIPIKKSFN